VRLPSDMYSLAQQPDLPCLAGLCPPSRRRPLHLSRNREPKVHLENENRPRANPPNQVKQLKVMALKLEITWRCLSGRCCSTQSSSRDHSRRWLEDQLSVPDVEFLNSAEIEALEQLYKSLFQFRKIRFPNERWHFKTAVYTADLPCAAPDSASRAGSVRRPARSVSCVAKSKRVDFFSW
jgi:hypothetical protein